MPVKSTPQRTSTPPQLTPFAQLLKNWMDTRSPLPGDFGIYKLATLVGVSHTTVKPWFQSEAIPNIATLIKLAQKTAEYDKQYAPWSDPPGISLEEMLAAIGIDIPTAQQFVQFAVEFTQSASISQAEREKHLKWITMLWESFQQKEMESTNSITDTNSAVS